MLSRAYIFLFLLLLLSCQIVKEDFPDGTREMRLSMSSSELQLLEAGEGQLNFEFHYEIAIVDEEGIEEIRWRFALVDLKKNVLAEHEQHMRKAEPEKNLILVQGDRERQLEIPSGLLRPGETYVIWVWLYYRGEILGELLTGIQPSA